MIFVILGYLKGILKENTRIDSIQHIYIYTIYIYIYMQHVYMYMYILCFTCTCFNNINIIAVADWWCRTVGVYDCSAGRHRKNPRKRKTEKRLKGKRIIWIHAMVSGPTNPLDAEKNFPCHVWCRLECNSLFTGPWTHPLVLNTICPWTSLCYLHHPGTPGESCRKNICRKKKKHAEIFGTLLTCPHPPVFSGEKDGNIFTVSTDHPPSPQHHQWCRSLSGDSVCMSRFQASWGFMLRCGKK